MVSSGQALRLKALGLPDKNGKYGDLKVKMKIVIPKDLTSKEIELYKQLADGAGRGFALHRSKVQKG